jgi:hypothetical protein
MRFGLGLTLMNDGYFAYEFGDTWHDNDWWYDELDFDLGYPLGPAEHAALGGDSPLQLLPGGDFEVWDGDGPWGYWADTDAGYRAVPAIDGKNPGRGDASARMDISAAQGEDWRITLYTGGIALTEEITYDLTFRARADRERTVTVGFQKGSPDWEIYSRFAVVRLSSEWRDYTLTFEASGTDPDARLHFLLGAETGSVWIDDVRMEIHPSEILRREFDHGLVLLNPTRAEQTIELETGWRRLEGEQAPRHEWLADDSDAGFSSSSAQIAALDTAEYLAIGPFYHSWGGSLHRLDGGGWAEWRLEIPESDTYSMDVWWPAAPEQSGWNRAARYGVRAGGATVGSIVLDQTDTGDVWRPLGSFSLPAGSAASVRLTCPGADPCAADALYLRSTARYNDGSPVRAITLQPLDAIVLQREEQGA